MRPMAAFGGRVALVLGLLCAIATTGSLQAKEESDEATEARSLCLGDETFNAKPICEQVLVHAPEDREVIGHLAQVLLSHNVGPQAIELYERLVDLDPSDPDGYFRLAAAHATLFQYGAAVGPVRVAMRLRPKHVNTFRLASIIFENLHEEEMAFSVHMNLANHGERTGMYDLTNLATVRDYTLKLTLIDTAWGTSLSAFVTLVVWLVAR